MSNTFDFNRFALLIKRQWQEFGKIYLITLMVVTGVIVLIYLFGMPKQDDGYNEYSRLMLFRRPLFFILGFLFISLIAGSYFVSMGQKSRAIVELMVPGSILEKYLCAIFYTSVVSVLSFVIVFMVTDLIFINYLRSVFEPVVQTKASGNFKSDFYFIIREYNEPITKVFYLWPFAVTSVFLLGSIYFNRFHYIKTSMVLIAFGFLLVYGIYRFGEWINKGKILFETERRSSGPDDLLLWSLLAGGIMALIFWYIGYIRLKEKEV